MTNPIFSGLQAFWGIWIIGQFWCFLYAGLGLAIPMGLVGLAFGWLQIILITQGQIQPHLGTAGFGQALKTILGKIYSIVTF
ncbi:MAG TPA: hypothetical protein VFP93_03320 [Gammaproteobacteria bacterium]|nr:hypothetical protein [Gammaproteobacteria bacterium]